eukprot:scaffold10510_cov84-Skeletonema_dohrnii-CCMP3373.AAC.3
MAAEHYYTYTGRDDEIIPHDVTHVRVHKSVKVIPANAFEGRRNIEEVICDVGVEKIEADAFSFCASLRLVIMPGVKIVSDGAFWNCKALSDVECGKLEIIGEWAFKRCNSLRSINLPSVKIVKLCAFGWCEALADITFGNKLERIEVGAFVYCPLERITLPLKDGMFTRDNTFTGCENLEQVYLGGGIYETVAALQLEGWRNDIHEEIDSINQILPTAPAGGDTDDDMGGKAVVIRSWIRSVLHKIIRYKEQHHRLLMEAATTLELTLPNDIVIENVLPFLELPSYTFEVEG